MKEIYKNYFQKSFNFLFPLLEFKRKDIHPVNTYLGILNKYTEKDYKLVCIYKKEPTLIWKNFYINKLLAHPLLENVEMENENEVILIFDLYSYKDDYDIFLKGEYSKLSDNCKMKIINYFKVGSSSWAYIDSFLFPEKHKEIYAELLNVSPDILTELCDKYNEKLEILN